MGRCIYVNVELAEETLRKLKEKTGIDTTKDALREAIAHYLDCFITKNEVLERSNTKGKKGGRTPSYLTPLIEKCGVGK
ncbi:MAG: DUF5371 family protein [Halobacteriota archaeon]